MSLAALDLNLLLVLDTVLAERSVVRAARRLHVTPSAVSNSLARLRGALEDPLLVRSGRGVVPTPRAAALAPAIARALRDLDQALHGDAFDPATTDRELTLAIADVVQVVKLPAIVAALARRMPRARLRVLSIDALVASGGLAGTAVDVVLGAGDKGAGVHVRPLYEERIVLVARAGHPTIRARLTKAQLASLRHVDVQVAQGTSNQGLVASYAALGITRDVRLVVPSFTAAAAVVSGTDLVASLPASLLEVFGKRLALRRVATPLATVATTINLLWHERTDGDPALRSFRDVLVQAVAFVSSGGDVLRLESPGGAQRSAVSKASENEVPAQSRGRAVGRPDRDPAVIATSDRVLLVDDEPGLLRALARILTTAGFTVSTASDGTEAAALIEAKAFDVIVSDIRMPGRDGLSLLRVVRDKDLDLPVVFLTASPTLETAIQAIEHGAFRYLTKPVDSTELTRLVQRAAQLRRMAMVRRQAIEVGHGRSIGDIAGLEARFESALDKMWIATQPILSWRTRSVFAYEALLRTEEPSLRNPVEFIDAAERLRRTSELGRRIRERVADHLINLPSSVSVFVNVHPRDLVDEELSSRAGALTPFARGVVLEVTERAALEQIPDLIPAVAKLRELGYRIALDDLGAGYAGLSSFALLQPEVVKVDMSLVRGIHLSPTKQKLFRSFASLCKDLAVEIVAEGVEVVEERDCLNDLGGDLYQGYLFARPGREFPKPVYDADDL